MSFILTVIWFLVALGILVTFHEYGHFYVARRCGVKVLRFSIGFGTPLVTWHDRQGTEYVIASIPLGGYVKMLDEREGNVDPAELSMAFTQKTVWQRMAIVSAGPIANFILAIFFYFLLALMGINGIAPVVGGVQGLAQSSGISIDDEIVSIDDKPTQTWSQVYDALLARVGDTGTVKISTREFDRATSVETHSIRIESWLGDNDRPELLNELGITPKEPVIDWTIRQVAPESPADLMGIKAGDRLLAADGMELVNWREWVEYVRAHPDSSIELLIEREGQEISFDVQPKLVDVEGELIPQLGIMPEAYWPDSMKRSQTFSVFEAVGYGFSKTWDQAVAILSFLKKLITLDISVKSMGGTLTIAQVAGDTAAAGLTYYLGFLAFFSVSLGVFNLLPIPVLDGGHLLFYGIEAIKGKPVSERIQMLGYQMGVALIVSVMIIAHYNDFVRLFS